MTVKWIGDAAAELGLTPLDAVEILASRQEYPMNGFLDEDRFKTLKLMHGGHRVEASGSHSMQAPQGLAPSAPAPAPAAPVKTPATSPSTAPVHVPVAPPHPPAPAPAAAPPQPPHVVPAPPPVRPPVGEATSVTTPLPTMPGPEGERTVILSPIDPKR